MYVVNPMGYMILYSDIDLENCYINGKLTMFA